MKRIVSFHKKKHVHTEIKKKNFSSLVFKNYALKIFKLQEWKRYSRQILTYRRQQHKYKTN